MAMSVRSTKYNPPFIFFFSMFVNNVFQINSLKTFPQSQTECERVCFFGSTLQNMCIGIILYGSSKVVKQRIEGIFWFYFVLKKYRDTKHHNYHYTIYYFNKPSLLYRFKKFRPVYTEHMYKLMLYYCP